MTNRALLAQVHIAKKEMGLDDDTYRLILQNKIGKESVKGASDLELRSVIDEFKVKGWKNSYRKKSFSKKKASFRKSDNALVRKIFVLWRECHRVGVIKNKSKLALQEFCKNQTKSDRIPDGIYQLEWLDNTQCNQIIETLKSMFERGEAKGEDG